MVAGASFRTTCAEAHGSNKLPAALKADETIPMIPGRCNRKRPIQYDKRRGKDGWPIEAMFNRPNDLRRVSICGDKLARDFLAPAQPATAVACWRQTGLNLDGGRLGTFARSAKYLPAQPLSNLDRTLKGIGGKFYPSPSLPHAASAHCLMTARMKVSMSGKLVTVSFSRSCSAFIAL